MPFDALVTVRRPIAVFDVLNNHGLRSVAWESLAAHKAAQQRRYGPSFWHRHQSVVSVLMVMASPVAGAAAAASGGFTTHSGVLAITGSFIWMCVVALITGTGLVRLRAGSHWEEREVSEDFLTDDNVPEAVTRVARSMLAEIPNARLILGELKREETVLDPYLLLEYSGECVCLGIWEADQVIACAG